MTYHLNIEVKINYTLFLQFQKCKIQIILLDNFTAVKYILKYRFYIFEV